LIVARRLSTQAVEILDLSGTVEMGLTAEGRPYRGSLDAPVVVLAYEDPRCTQCQDFFAQTEPYVLDEYIKTGVVREEAYLLPILGEASLPASEAAECAAEQGRFWEYRQLLFLNLPLIEQNAGRAELLTYARVAGLNLPAFTTCIDGGRHRTKLLRLATEAVVNGIDGAPTFVINGRTVPGARPFVGDEKGPGFQDFVEEALAGYSIR
jgi:protein-disulfide isomerase